jgi:hypothetical protein
VENVVIPTCHWVVVSFGRERSGFPEGGTAAAGAPAAGAAAAAAALPGAGAGGTTSWAKAAPRARLQAKNRAAAVLIDAKRLIFIR